MEQIQVGDKVRSYDFEGVDDCYIEGIVSGFEEWDGVQHYAIDVQRIIFDGKEITYDSDTTCVVVPINGTESLTGRVFDGVVLVQEATND